MSRRGISNVVATIILIAVAIALAVAVAVWVFGLAGGAAKTATLQIQAMSLNASSGTLTLMVSNPSSSAIGINAFTLGGLSCTLASSSTPVVIPGGAQGELTITIGSSVTASFNGGSSSSFTCTGSQTITPGVQYSGTIVTTSGQQYPFTVTASS